MAIGIHHITAIAGDPQANLDFYTGVLGLRLVKVTINYDSPGTYHFYYGDRSGSPGSILTFFPWGAGGRGRPGLGQAVSIAFSVPQGSLPHWRERLDDHRVSIQEQESGISLQDPDGIQLSLVEFATEGDAWTGGGVPQAEAITGFHSVTLGSANPATTVHLMEEELGFRLVDETEKQYRLSGDPGLIGAQVVIPKGLATSGAMGVGTVHHVAWRTEDDDTQDELGARLIRRGLGVSPMRDRQYFHSIYFLEPGGVLFEIATDQPGFATDESAESLGTALKLPAWLEESRDRIEAELPEIRLPSAGVLS